MHGDKSLSRLDTTIADRATTTEHLSVTEKGVFRHRINGIEITPPFCLLRFPIKEGESWESAVTIGPDQITFTARTGKEEDVTVPAGEYKAVTVELEATSDGQTAKSRYWFVKDVGIVKITTESDGKNVDMQLTKFEKGK